MASFSNFKSTIVSASNEAAGTTAGVTVYANTDALPYVGNSDGDQAYVSSNNRLYIWQGSGWYSVALINTAPAISAVQDSDGNTTPFALALDGTVTTITITAADSDGDPITYSAVADSDFAGLATVSNSDNVFTITPFSLDSASTTSGTITFRATDGINIASSGVQTFTLNFVHALWDETVLSIGTSSTNSLENSTFIDRSTNAHTVTPTGSPVQTAFHPYLDKWSGDFDGSGDYLSVASDASFDCGTGNFTIEAWVYIRSETNAYPIICGNANTPYTAAGSLAFGNHNVDNASYNNKFIITGSDGGLRFADSTTHPLNTWIHIAVVRDSATSLKMFRDGVQTASTTISSSYTFNWGLNGFRVGGGNWDGANRSEIDGYISNLRLVKGTALYTANFTPPTKKLTAVSGTSLLTCQSNRFIDNSTNAHAITPVGNVKVSAYNPFGQGIEYAVGENKGSVSLDGSSDYMSISDTTAFDFSSGYTCVEAWIYPKSIATGGGRNHIFTRGQTVSPYNGVYLRLENGYPDLAGSNNDLQSPTICKVNEWSHVVFQFNPNGEQSIWLNGVRVADRSNGPSTVEVDVTNGIGHYDGGSIFDGYISDLKIRNGVSAFYSGSTITPPTAPVGNTNASLYLPMDNAGIFDKTGNHTLTLVGDPATSTTQTKYANTSVYQSVDVIHIGDFNYELINSDWTLEGWFYSQGTASVNTMFHINNDGSPSGVHVHHDASGTVKVDDGAVATNNFGTMALNQWQHLAIVRNNGTTTAYVNGTSVGNHTSWDPESPTNRLQLGRYASNTSYTYTGYHENVQFVHGVAKYTANFTPPTLEQGIGYQAED